MHRRRWTSSVRQLRGVDVTGEDLARAANPYGLAHEHELWVEFQREMNGTDASHWLYNGNSVKDRPADLGYFVGARICGAYYARASEKGRAIREIFAMARPCRVFGKERVLSVTATSARPLWVPALVRRFGFALEIGGLMSDVRCRTSDFERPAVRLPAESDLRMAVIHLATRSFAL